MDEEKKQEALQIGVLVLVILAMLTIGEYAFAVIAVTWLQPLVLIAVLKAAYVIRDYMHISRIFAPDEEEHA